MPYRDLTSSSWTEHDLWLWLDHALEAVLNDPHWAATLAYDVWMNSDGFPDVRIAVEALLVELETSEQS
jgi:hypothetical protein